MVKVDGSGGGQALIRVRGLDKSYIRGGEEIHVLQGLNLDVDAGEFIAFMGPSGSGKTTLLNLLGGLDVPTSGTVSVAGDEITSMSRRKLTAWRARHATVRLLLERGAPVDARDGKGRTPLILAVKACVDSYWTESRSPESVAALLDAGAAVAGVAFPSGYADVDDLLRARGAA